MLAVIFPDVELWATGALRAALAGRTEPYAQGVYVSNTIPDPRRDRMVIFRRDGGPRLDRIRETARMAIQVWGSTEQEATDLARLTAALITAAADGNPVLRVDQMFGITPVPDPSLQPLRYMTLELIVRGTNLT